MAGALGEYGWGIQAWHATCYLTFELADKSAFEQSTGVFDLYRGLCQATFESAHLGDA
jgi:hypothetical protein